MTGACGGSGAPACPTLGAYGVGGADPRTGVRSDLRSRSYRSPRGNARTRRSPTGSASRSRARRETRSSGPPGTCGASEERGVMIRSTPHESVRRSASPQQWIHSSERRQGRPVLVARVAVPTRAPLGTGGWLGRRGRWPNPASASCARGGRYPRRVGGGSGEPPRRPGRRPRNARSGRRWRPGR